ncbi:MAG: hypothetical protein ACLF0P_03160 [Thermoanaerobaculia bacterium]
MPDPSLPYTELDPFALPTETDGRFRMLVAAALVLAWGTAAAVAPGLVISDRDLEPSPEEREIAERAMAGGITSLSAAELGAVVETGTGGRSAELLGRWLARMGASILLVLTTAGGAWLLYRTHPRWRGLHRRVGPLTPETAPGPVRELRRLIDREGLPRGVTLGHLPGRSFDGLTFGPPGRETVALTCPRDLLEPAWEELMRPVAYHELGHVANGDVRNQEASLALWIVVGALLLPLTVYSLTRSSPEALPETTGLLGHAAGAGAGADLVRDAVFLGVIWWIWAGLLRVRELYADARVVAWGRKESLLRRLRLPDGRSGSRPFRVLAGLAESRPWLGRALDAIREVGLYHHPTNARRARAVRDPRPLFRVSYGLAFLTGLLLTTVVARGELAAFDLVLMARAAGTFLALLFGSWGILLVAGVLLGGLSLLAYLVTGALGVQVQRQAVADLAAGRRSDWGYLRLGRPAASFALGVEAGLLLTPASFLLAPVPAVYVLAWLAGFAALTWSWLAYVHAMSRFFLGSALGAQVPRRRQVWLGRISAVLLAVLYSPALAVRLTLHRSGDLAPGHAAGVSGGDSVEAFVYTYVLTTIVVMVAALAIYSLAGLASTLFAAFRLARGRPACPTCGEAPAPRLVVGRRCDGCRASLAPWLLREPVEPPPTGRPA